MVVLRFGRLVIFKMEVLVATRPKLWVLVKGLTTTTTTNEKDQDDDLRG
jgi:hypothetical protein